MARFGRRQLCNCVGWFRSGPVSFGTVPEDDFWREVRAVNGGVTCGDLVVSWWVLVLRVWQSIFAAPEGEASLIQAEPANRLALCPNCLHGSFQ